MRWRCLAVCVDFAPRARTHAERLAFVFFTLRGIRPRFYFVFTDTRACTVIDYNWLAMSEPSVHEASATAEATGEDTRKHKHKKHSKRHDNSTSEQHNVTESESAVQSERNSERNSQVQADSKSKQDASSPATIISSKPRAIVRTPSAQSRSLSRLSSLNEDRNPWDGLENKEGQVQQLVGAKNKAKWLPRYVTLRRAIVTVFEVSLFVRFIRLLLNCGRNKQAKQAIASCSMRIACSMSMSRSASRTRL
jgi:hypothetical protein